MKPIIYRTRSGTAKRTAATVARLSAVVLALLAIRTAYVVGRDSGRAEGVRAGWSSGRTEGMRVGKAIGMLDGYFASGGSGIDTGSKPAREALDARARPPTSDATADAPTTHIED